MPVLPNQRHERARRIPVAAAKRFALEHGLEQLIMIGSDGELTHIVTWGKTKKLCRQAAEAQDWWNGKVLPRAG